MKPAHVNPSNALYQQLQLAYDHFNETLFSSKLPLCFFTLQRRGRVLGLFGRSRWCDKKGVEIHEIALNPARFAECSLTQILQELVREQCHIWQHEYGTPSRANYHNQEWADQMELVGLMPSDTGEPGGKRTGQNVLHYTIERGPFEHACLTLVKKGFDIEWLDRNFIADSWPIKKIVPASKPAKNSQAYLDSVIRARFGKMSHWISDLPKSRNKVKYTCPRCGANLWGKPDLSISCQGCGRLFAVA